MNLKDKTVVVTGANRGIGRALVGDALERGAERVYAGTRRPLAYLERRVTAVSVETVGRQFASLPQAAVA